MPAASSPDTDPGLFPDTAPSMLFMRFVYHTAINHLMTISSEKGADELVWIAEGTPGRTWQPGEYYEKRKPAPSTGQSRDPALARQFWGRSAELRPSPPDKTTVKGVTMQHRTLGRQGLTVSAIGYGAMGISMAYGPSDEQASIATIRRAHALGVTFVDTAELYGWGHRWPCAPGSSAGSADDTSQVAGNLPGTLDRA